MSLLQSGARVDVEYFLAPGFFLDFPLPTSLAIVIVSVLSQATAGAVAAKPSEGVYKTFLHYFFFKLHLSAWHKWSTPSCAPLLSSRGGTPL